VPWESFRGDIEAAVLTTETERKSAAGRKPIDAWWELRKERQDVAAPQLPADDYPAFRINIVDLEYRLGDVETDRCNRLYVWLL
jgi:hypothetical protein